MRITSACGCSVSTPTLQPQADVIRIHAYGEEGKIELAKAAYDRVAANLQFQSDELTNELHRKYILGENTQHDDEWVFDREVNMLLAATSQSITSYHIRGMILLRMGRVDEALHVFEQGVIGNPWPSEKEFFRTALGIAWMQQRNFLEASQILEEVSTPTLQPQADVIRIHAYGEEGKIELAKAAYDRVAAN